MLKINLTCLGNYKVNKPLYVENVSYLTKEFFYLIHNLLRKITSYCLLEIITMISLKQ